MPLSEFLRTIGRRHEPGQQKPCPSDLSSRSDNDLVELVWENGQVMMQGQSSRATRTPALNTLSSNTPRIPEATGVGNSSRIGKFGVESILNDISPVVPSGDLDLTQDDEMVPWLSYPIDHALAQDYGSDILPEISGVTGNGLSTQNSFFSMDKRSSYEQHTVGNSLKASSASRARLLSLWPPQHRNTSDALGSGMSDIISNNNNTGNHLDAVYRNPAQCRNAAKDSTLSSKMGSPCNNQKLLNFSNFSRLANLIKPNIHSSRDGIPASVSSGVEAKEKGSLASGSNQVKSTLIQRINSTPRENDFLLSSTMVNSKAIKESGPPEKTENLTSMKNDKPLIPSNTANSTNGIPDGERTVEPMVAASSSVGSGNSADRVSCEQTHNSKRKFRDIEDSECRSDDIETESLGVKKATPNRGGSSKRSRAAEVHNLSERRRRDRINEKMCALQELIPNCNKADKASMLDEAIEYLKTLQLQVQIMSMGAGLCMPPMMFPTPMQHMHHHGHVPHFPPMGMGMGMGIGFGMGMPRMPMSHFSSPMPGPTNFQRIPCPNLPGHPGQVLPNSAPRAPLVPIIRQPSTMDEVTHASPVVDPTANTNPMCGGEAGGSINHKSNQMQATNEVLDHSPTSQENKQAADANCPTEIDISKQPGYD